jgi:hypothetical protein
MPDLSTVANLKARFLLVLASQNGYREGRDPDGNWNNDTMYGKWYGFNRVSWCHIFMYWAAFVAGISKIVPKTAYTPDGYNWFKTRGQAVTVPQVGDLGYVRGYVASEKRTRVHHVFAVVGVDGDYVITEEGNTNNSGSAQGNGVYRLRRAWAGPNRKDLLFGRPDWAAAVVPVTPAKPPAKPPTSSDSPAPAKPIVSLKACVYSALHPGQYLPDGVDDVVRVKARLVALGIALSTDSFRGAYRKWQLHLNYTGADADGIPGLQTLTILGNNSGWTIVA